jgi:hypothetical protein
MRNPKVTSVGRLAALLSIMAGKIIRHYVGRNAATKAAPFEQLNRADGGER